MTNSGQILAGVAVILGAAVYVWLVAEPIAGWLIWLAYAK